MTHLQDGNRIFGELDRLEAVVALEGPRPQLGDVVLRQIEFHQNLQIAKSVFVDKPKLFHFFQLDKLQFRELD